MASWNTRKQLIAIGSGAFAICALAVAGVYYAEGLIEEVEAQITQKKELIAIAEAKIEKIPSIEKEVIILRENLQEYVKILPDTKELTNFLRQLNQFERQSEISSKSLTQKPTPPGAATSRFIPIEYTCEISATLWQFLKFINLIENYERFVSITDYQITSGDSVRKDENARSGDTVHSVRLTLQTFEYNAQATGKEVEIPDYAVQREALRDEIVKRLQAIRIDKWEWPGQQGRRDIFVDPRERADQHTDGPTPTEQRALLERYIGELSRLREMHQRMKRTDITLFEQYALEKGIKEGIERIESNISTDQDRVTYAPYRLRWAREVVTPFADLRTQIAMANVEPGRSDGAMPLRELGQLVADMDADCRSGQLEVAKNRFETVASRLNVPPTDPRHEFVVKAKSLHAKASTALDFKGMDLKIQGVVVNHDGKSGVLLNGEVYEEGDYISDELLVKLVEEDQIWFVFRGLTLVRTM